MLFPSLDQSSSRLVRFSVSSVLVIQSVIATIAIDAIASTQPNWIASQQAAAQSRPSTPSTSARDLSGLKEANCHSSNPDGVPEEKPIFCGGIGVFREDESDSSVYLILKNSNLSIPPFDAENLFDFMRVSSQGCQPSRDRVVLFCAPLF